MDRDARRKRREERRAERRANRKPFKETKVGKFLSGTGSKILDIVGDLTPAGGVIDTVADLIVGDKDLNNQEKELALNLLEIDKAELAEITKRWEADLKSDSFLAKNIRPLVLGYLVFTTTVLIILDSANALTVSEDWIDLIKYILGTVILAYFGSRGGEKIVKSWKE